MTFNLATILEEAAGQRPDDAAARFADQVMTYAELDQLSSALAQGLGLRDVSPGQVVALQLPNVPEFLVAYFGALKAGAIVLPLNPRLTNPEMRYHLKDAGARILITDIACVSESQAAADAVGCAVFVHAPDPITCPPGAPARAFGELLVARSAPLHAYGTEPGDTAVLIYTSGTTGRPKGTELSHFQLFMNAVQAGELLGLTPCDSCLVVLPLFHIFGLSTANAAVRYGASVSLMTRFEPDSVLRNVAEHRVSAIFGVPTMLQAFLSIDISGLELSNLRLAASGGASLSGEALAAFESKFGIPVLEGYGLTETTSTCTFNRSISDRRVRSVGRPVWGVRVGVVDPDGTALPPGRENVGEVVVRGYNVMKGYRNRPDETAKVIRDGWFHTGDLGYFDDDGFLFIVGRIKDVIIRGGFNVYPREVEEALLELSAVADAAVIGRADGRLGEEIVAMVVLRTGHCLGVDELSEYCRRRLAGYKRPRAVWFLDSLPKGATGKIDKSALRAWAAVSGPEAPAAARAHGANVQLLGGAGPSGCERE